MNTLFDILIFRRLLVLIACCLTGNTCLLWAQDPQVDSVEQSEVNFPSWYQEAISEISTGNVRLVTTEPCATRHQAEMQLKAEMVRAAEEFFGEFHPDNQLDRVRESPEFWRATAVKLDRYSIVPIDDANLKSIVPEFNRVSEPHYRGFAQVAFDESQWNQLILQDRLNLAALVGFALFGCLTVLWGFLRLDQATRGFHTGRLQLSALTALVVLGGIVFLISRWL